MCRAVERRPSYGSRSPTASWSGFATVDTGAAASCCCFAEAADPHLCASLFVGLTEMAVGTSKTGLDSKREDRDNGNLLRFTATAIHHAKSRN